ncbi:SBBP repeat-containing protein, partial [Paenibacillus sp. MCAF20]
MTGQTLSLDFPISPGAFQPGKDGSSSAFVSKMNSSGTFLEYSTFIGGNSFDLGRGIAVDDSGQAYVTGQTLSPDFPTTPGAFQTDIGGAQDAFVTKLSPDGSFLVYSTFLGGEGVDTGFGITVDNTGSAYVTGGTSSVNFPLINAFQGFIANEHAFVTKFNPDGSALEYSTLLGGHGIDEGRGIAVDGAGQAYVTGLTTSVDFPTTPGAFQINLTGVIGAFVSKVEPLGFALGYSTFLTGNGDDEGHGIAVDELGQAYVTGSTT